MNALREQHASNRKSNSGPDYNVVRVGDVVLIHDHVKPRLQWQLAIVTALNVGLDGLVRSVKIRTKNGHTSRPINKLYPLELNVGPLPVESTVADGGHIDPPDTTSRKAAILAKKRIRQLMDNN